MCVMHAVKPLLKENMQIEEQCYDYKCIEKVHATLSVSRDNMTQI